MNDQEFKRYIEKCEEVLQTMGIYTKEDLKAIFPFLFVEQEKMEEAFIENLLQFEPTDQ